MNYVKLFFVALSIVSSLKNVIVPLEKFNRAKTLELFGKVYDQLPNHPTSKEAFLQSVDKWLSLYILIVNIIWEFNPEFCHKLAWSIVKAEQAAWLSIVEKVQKYLKAYFIIDDEINKKANDYIHTYNLKVLDALLEKDLESQQKQWDYWLNRMFTKEVEILKEKLMGLSGSGDGLVGDWLIYMDHTGIHVNKDKEVKKWTGTKYYYQ
jgi:hypothetical protein